MKKMMKYKHFQVIVILLYSMVVFGIGSFAYGYHFFEADRNGCKWTSTPINFVVDASSTTAKGDALLATANTIKAKWNDIATGKDVIGNMTKAAVDFVDFTENATNSFGNAWGKGHETGGVSDNVNEIVLDETGKIITNVFAGNPNQLLGVGLSLKDKSGGGCTIKDGLLFLNGTGADADQLATAVHELGHVLGLAHSSVSEFNSKNNSAFNGGFGSPSAALDPIHINNVPVMHPFATGTGSEPQTPRQDDIAGFSELYPEPTFTTTLGGISGTVTKCSDDTPLEGVNVRAVNMTDSSVQVTRYSAFDSNGTGKYVINGLPPGNYKVIIEPMGFNGFTKGRMAIKTRTDSGFPTEYYGPTADEESKCTEEIPDTPLTVAVADGDAVAAGGAISVTAGDTTSNINFKVGGVTLAFVVDDTGSMGSEISSVKDILNNFVDTLDALASTIPLISFPDTALITFKDNVTLRTVSNDPDKLRTAISSLSAFGGGDCPESSNSALMEAGRLLSKGGVALLFTDADSRSDGPNRTAVQNLYRSKSLTLSVLLSATCDASFDAAAGDVIYSNAFQGAEGEPVIPAGDKFPEEPTLGSEDAVTTFSEIATETGGTFKATPRPSFGDRKTTYVNTGTNISVSSVVPAVSLVTPGSAPHGVTVNLEIKGANTSWNSSSTVAIGGNTSFINSTTVNSPTSITVNVTIPSGTPTDFYDVTVTTVLGDPLSDVSIAADTEIGTGTGAFQVTDPTGDPDITSVTPSKGAIGETLNININAIDSNFDATTTVSFIDGFTEDTKITVNSVTVDSPVLLRVNVTIASDADVGLRDVRVTTGSEVITETDSFLVSSPPPEIARVISLNPSNGTTGDTNLDVVITGENTNFVNGSSVASFSGAGITVVSTTVTSPTMATARINIATNAPFGFRDVIVTTVDETAVLLDGFQINEGSGIFITANDSGGTITHSSGTLSVKVSLLPGASAGFPVDWWVAVDTPFGWFYYDLITSSFVFAGASPFDIRVTHQGPLFELSTPFEVLSMTGLTSGTYTFYFAVDTIMNGVLNLDSIVFDSVRVVVP